MDWSATRLDSLEPGQVTATTYNMEGSMKVESGRWKECKGPSITVASLPQAAYSMSYSPRVPLHSFIAPYFIASTVVQLHG